MNILILGATGYLGTKLIDRLDSKKNDIYALVRKSSDKGLLLRKGLLKEHIWEIDDLYEQLFMNNGIHIDWFINCACCYVRKNVKDSQIINANYFTPLNCILLCIEHGIKKFINIDTGLPENYNIYTKSKGQLSDMLKWYARKKGLFVLNILLENYYGIDEPKDRFLPDTIEKMKKNEDIFLTEGLQKRDFIYIEDVVDAIIFLMNTENKCNYLDIPLGTGEGPMIKEVIQYLAQLINSSSRLLFGEVPNRKNEPDSIADIRILQKMGWKYKYDWKTGMKKIIGNC